MQYIRLNKLSSFDPDFSPYPCTAEGRGAGGPNNPSCVPEVWVSPDPRLISPIRGGQRLALNAPPINGKVKPADIYNKRPGYTLPPSYPSFQCITNGQIRYYINKNLAKPFISTLFTTPAKAIKYNYVDPMGSCKPHHIRCPTDNPNTCLSWINDSQMHREDLMSRQLWRRNQSNYGVNKICNHT